jgi:hypothetical protein
VEFLPDDSQNDFQTGETMSKRPRRNYSPAITVKLALAATKGYKT